MPSLALPAREAAELVGCKDRVQFMREVRAGHWPKPLPIPSRPRRWCRAALERRLAELAGMQEAEVDWDRYIEQALGQHQAP